MRLLREQTCRRGKEFRRGRGVEGGGESVEAEKKQHLKKDKNKLQRLRFLFPLYIFFFPLDFFVSLRCFFFRVIELEFEVRGLECRG